MHGELVYFMEIGEGIEIWAWIIKGKQQKQHTWMQVVLSDHKRYEPMGFICRKHEKSFQIQPALHWAGAGRGHFQAMGQEVPANTWVTSLY